MHEEILTKEQVILLPLLKKFSSDFYLVGGTAIALYLGHRRSVDFDLFTAREFKNVNLKKKIKDFAAIDEEYVNKKGEFTLIVKGVKMTFFHYPFTVPAPERFSATIHLPALVDLAAMKAYALGQRAKWKDYVDLFFILRKHHGVGIVAQRARKLFGHEFNEKIFRVQLCYFPDIDYSEEVIFMKGHAVSETQIKKGLTEFSLAR